MRYSDSFGVLKFRNIFGSFRKKLTRGRQSVQKSPVSLPLNEEDLYRPPRGIFVLFAFLLALIGSTLTLGLPVTTILTNGVSLRVIYFTLFLSGTLFVVGLLPFYVKGQMALNGFVKLYGFQKTMRRIFWIPYFSFILTLISAFFVSIPSWTVNFEYLLIIGLIPYYV